MLGDLDEAIRHGRTAVTQAAELGRSPAWTLPSLANALVIKYQLTRDAELIDEAVDAFRRSLDHQIPGSAEQATQLSNLGRALRIRSRGGSGLAALADAFQAVHYARAAVAASPASDPEHFRWTSNLVAALTQRAALTDGTADLEEAVRLAQTAVLATPREHPELAWRTLCWTDAHAALLHATGKEGHARAAIDLLRESTAALHGPVTDRVRAGREWGRITAGLDRWPLALAGYQEAVRLLPLTVSRDMDRASGEAMVESAGELSREAASCAVHTGQPELAVALLESGRAILWSQQLDSRTGSRLLTTAHPELAARLSQIHADLTA